MVSLQIIQFNETFNPFKKKKLLSFEGPYLSYRFKLISEM